MKVRYLSSSTFSFVFRGFSVVALLAVCWGMSASRAEAAGVLAGESSLIEHYLYQCDFDKDNGGNWVGHHTGWDRLRAPSQNAEITLDLLQYLSGDLGNDFVIQFDTTLVTDRVDVTLGGNNYTRGIYSKTDGFSIFLRESNELGIYNAPSGEKKLTGFASTAKKSEWNNFALRFMRDTNEIEYFINEQSVGVVSLNGVPFTISSTATTAEFNPIMLGLSFLGTATGTDPDTHGWFDNMQIGWYSIPFYSVADGTWENGVSWNRNPEIPTATTNPVVQDGKHITVTSAAAEAGIVTVKPDSQLSVNAGAKLAASQLSSTGSLNLTGELALSGADVSNIAAMHVAGNSARLTNAGNVNLTSATFAGGAMLTKAGAGTLSIADAPNGAFRVSEGLVRAGADANLANTTFTMDGGAVFLPGEGSPGLNFYWFAESSYAAFDGKNNGTYLLTGAAADGTISTILNGYAIRDGDFAYRTNVMNADLGNPGAGSNYAMVWTGYFQADTDLYSLWIRADDTTSFWIDLNQDGVFQDNERIVKSHWNDGGSSGSMTLTPGETYAVAMVFTEAGGGDIYQFQVAPGSVNLSNSSTESGYYVFGPNSNGGTWQTAVSIGAADYSTTNFNVTANSSLQLAGREYRLGKLNFQADNTLSLEGGAEKVSFTGLAGTGTLRFDNSGVFGQVVLGGDDASLWEVNITDTGSDAVHFESDLQLGDQLTIDVHNLATAPLDPMKGYLIGLIDGDFELDGIQLSDIMITSLNDSAVVSRASLWFDDPSGSLYLTGLEGSGGGGSAVPEPATWLMLLAGFAAVVIIRRRPS